MILYRISRREYINDLSGTGAFLYGGRWNSKGVRALYTSGSVSLAILEIIANLSVEQINTGLYLAELDFPDHLPISPIEQLPANWNEHPHNAETVKYGSQFLKGNGLCLKTPSAIVPTEYNYILNPLHEDFLKIRLLDIRPILIDHRIFIK